MFAHPSGSSRPLTKRTQKANKKQKKYLLPHMHTCHTMLFFGPWAKYQYLSARKRWAWQCHATHKTHPAEWQISVATRPGHLMSFLPTTKCAEKNSPIYLSLLRNNIHGQYFCSVLRFRSHHDEMTEAQWGQYGAHVSFSKTVADAVCKFAIVRQVPPKPCRRRVFGVQLIRGLARCLPAWLMRQRHLLSWVI